MAGAINSLAGIIKQAPIVAAISRAHDQTGTTRFGAMATASEILQAVRALAGGRFLREPDVATIAADPQTRLTPDRWMRSGIEGAIPPSPF